MKINELEKILNISRANIRFYEKEGLLKPVRKENNYREYDENEIAILKKIIIYRKLGISIHDIRNIFDGNIALNDAVAKSVNLLQNEILDLNVSMELCKEICNKNIDNFNFDEDYYWNEIHNRESKGEEFFDFSGIDITGFDNKKRIKILIIIFMASFFVGVLYSTLCAKSYQHNNEYYDIIQNEIDTFCVIDTLKTDTENKLLYICYDDASCVNVYNFNGEFLWSVSVPCDENSRGVTYFYIDNGRLIIDRDEDIYVYNALTGEFIEKTYIEKLGIDDWRDTYDQYHADDLKKSTEVGFVFDFYNVYKIDDNGNLTERIIEKPDWYILTNDIWGVLIASVGAIGLFVIIVLGTFKKLGKIPADNKKIGKNSKNIAIFLKVLFILLLLYSVLSIVITVFSHSFLSVGVLPSSMISVISLIVYDVISTGIFPLALIFIISLIVYDLISKKFNETEKRLCGIWRNCCIVAFALNIASVIVAQFISEI